MNALQRMAQAVSRLWNKDSVTETWTTTRQPSIPNPVEETVFNVVYAIEQRSLISVHDSTDAPYWFKLPNHWTYDVDNCTYYATKEQAAFDIVAYGMRNCKVVRFGLPADSKIELAPASPEFAQHLSSTMIDLQWYPLLWDHVQNSVGKGKTSRELTLYNALDSEERETFYLAERMAHLAYRSSLPEWRATRERLLVHLVESHSHARSVTKTKTTEGQSDEHDANA